jgi:hypothetical protein
MRHHCVQCLTEVFATGRQAPTGDTLCAPCYSALWGPKATDTLRQMVQKHSGLPSRNGQVAPAQS